MKRLITLLAVCVFFSGMTEAFAASDIKVVINGQSQTYDQPPVVKKGRTLVPLRGIFEALGAEVKWDGDTQTVTAIKGQTEIRLQIGWAMAYKNDKAVMLDVPAQLINGRTMVPVRFIAESLGAEVKWNADTQTVVVNDRTVSNKVALEEIFELVQDSYNVQYLEELLKEKNADPNIYDDTGLTPLMRASVKGNVEGVKLLLQYGADTELKDGDGYTALFLAVRFNQKEVVQILVDAGANVDVYVDKGVNHTPTEWAESFGYTEILEILKKTK
jgi:hypothetical protein